MSKLRTVSVEISELYRVTIAALCKKGFPEVQAREIAGCVIWAQLRGNPQGLAKVAQMEYRPRLEQMRIQDEEAMSPMSVLNAGFHHPMPALKLAVEHAAKVVQQNGLCMVVVRNTDQSSGALGYFTQLAARRYRMFALMTSSTPAWVAPFGGTHAAIGTNPISIAIPTRKGPVVFDASGAATSVYAVMQANRLVQPLPENVALNNKGFPTTNPSDVLNKGCIVSQGTLGSGLGVMVQLMSAFLMGSTSWGHILITAKPSVLGQIPLAVDEVVASIRRAGAEVLLPGERGDMQAHRVRASRRVQLETELFSSILKQAGMK